MVTQKTDQVSKIQFQLFLIFFLFNSENGLTLVEAPAIAPSEIQIDAKHIEEMQAELAEVENQQLPDDGEDDGF